MDYVAAAVMGFGAAVGLVFANKTGAALWSKFFGSHYVTEEKCAGRRRECHEHHTTETADTTQELREIRKILLILCHRMHIDPAEYQDLIL